ncbi:MAG TPA: DUF6438 domain-containing protein [Cyclobacteriaceae bacterium]|nr:DUF6438 domain-containing protein [Cyclobacteriaceae bacterium]
MKAQITIFLILIFGSLAAQNTDIKKIWVGNDLEYIKIDSQSVLFEVFGEHYQSKKYYRISDTLRLYDKYTTSTDNFSKQHTKNYDFLITKLTDRQLTLTPIESNALQLAGWKQEINYQERSLVKQSDIEFSKIIFRSTTCHGTCPSLTLQIDKEKNLLFIGGMYAIKQGHYSGILSDSLLNSLVAILKLSEVDKLKTWEQMVVDAPEYTLEIHYNDKVKYIKNFFLPSVTRELIQYLLEISKKVELKEAKEPFAISFTKQ